MRVDGREIPVAGSLLQPLIRRTSDIVRVVLSALLLATVIAGSLITRNRWDALETSVSDIVGFLTPDQSNLVYLLYGIAILALPFAILIGVIASRKWTLLVGYAAAALLAGLSLSITGTGISTPEWHLEVPDRFDSFLAQFLDDSRWIAMLAAVLTVSGPCTCRLCGRHPGPRSAPRRCRARIGETWTHRDRVQGAAAGGAWTTDSGRDIRYAGL